MELKMPLIKIISCITVTALVCLACTASMIAGDSKEKKHEVIMIKKKLSDGSTTNLEFDSDKNGAFLHDLADGESKTVSSASGDTVTVTRNGDELTINTNGENISLPMPGDISGKQIKIMRFDNDTPGDIEIDLDIEMPEGISISSSRELDTATQETIQAAIANAGIQDKVHFNQGHHGISRAIFLSKDGEMSNLDLDGADVQEFTTDDGKHVKIIKKRIVVDEENN